MSAHDLSTLRALEARLVAANGPDRELDGDLLIAFGVAPPNAFGTDVAWSYRGAAEWVTSSPQRKMMDIVWKGMHLTASIDAAVALVERVLPGWHIDVRMWGDRSLGDAHAELWSNILIGATRASASTPALALCLALVRAVIAQQETGDAG